MTEPDLADWNQKVCELVQASLGAIIPEIRRISLSRRDSLWLVTVEVDRLDAVIEEDILDDIITEFEALQLGPVVSGRVDLVEGDLPILAEPSRTTYLRYDGSVTD